MWLTVPALAGAADGGLALDARTLLALADEIAALSISVNGTPEPGIAFVVRNAQGLLVDTETLNRLKLSWRSADSLRIEGRTYVPLRTMPGVRATISEQAQQLDFDIDPDLLPQARLRFGLPAPLLPQTPAWGGLFNYTVFGQSTSGQDFTTGLSRSLAGAFDAAAFGPIGVFGASALVNSTSARQAGAQSVVLLDAGWRWDDPEKLRTYRIGDAISAPGWWGRAVRFGGAQVTSNYALQPGYVTYPLLTVAGIAAVPTAAEIYSNNIRMGTQNVPAGPFAITNVPALNGAGELQVVVTNAFGQQQVISQQFYVTTQLLKPGLSEYSFSAGSAQFNYGLKNFDYQGYIGSAYYRYGVNDTLTVQGRAEGDNNVRSAGVGADYVVGYLGVLSTGIAASSSSGDLPGAKGTGERFLLGLSRQARLASFAVGSTWATPNYREIGDTALQESRTTRASFNVALPAEAGSFALIYSGQRFRDSIPPGPLHESQNGTLNIYTASYSVGLAKFGFLTLSASRSNGLSNQTQVLALWTLPFGTSNTSAADTTITLGGQSTRGDGQSSSYGTYDLQHPVPVGEGWGYYLHGQTDDIYTGGASYWGKYGRYSVDASHANGQSAVRGAVSGGIGLVGSHAFFAQPIDQSFALVTVGDVAGARVLQENIDVGRTGADGTLLLPRVPSYTAVNVAIDPASVPLDATIGKTVQKVVLLDRTGIVINFESRRERNALIRLTLPDGTPLPAGAVARVVGRAEPYPVAMGGEVYITDLSDHQDVDIMWHGQTCRIPIALEKHAQPVADLGPFVCALH
ncbi:MAG TPA: fimbria/pilus outer membrane usher protein [Casimicrobiaceae bacterium]